jgi:hypothetical protein
MRVNTKYLRQQIKLLRGNPERWRTVAILLMMADVEAADRARYVAKKAKGCAKCGRPPGETVFATCDGCRAQMSRRADAQAARIGLRGHFPKWTTALIADAQKAARATYVELAAATPAPTAVGEDAQTA